jgi:hypothetical protein
MHKPTDTPIGYECIADVYCSDQIDQKRRKVFFVNADIFFLFMRMQAVPGEEWQIVLVGP